MLKFAEASDSPTIEQNDSKVEEKISPEAMKIYQELFDSFDVDENGQPPLDKEKVEIFVKPQDVSEKNEGISPEAMKIYQELFDSFDVDENGQPPLDRGYSETTQNSNDIQEMDKPFEKCADISDERKEFSEETDNSEYVSGCPIDGHGGSWDGERGNSTWHPDPDYVPPEKSKNPEDRPYSNPDNLSWREILDKYGIDGMDFKNGFPIFDEVSRGTVEIEDFETGGSDAKDRNFKRADIALAKQRGCTPEEVKKWREENNYTWHECEDKRTMQKVPNEVHANVPHNGGRSQ